MTSLQGIFGKFLPVGWQCLNEPFMTKFIAKWEVNNIQLLHLKLIKCTNFNIVGSNNCTSKLVQLKKKNYIPIAS